MTTQTEEDLAEIAKIAAEVAKHLSDGMGGIYALGRLNPTDGVRADLRDAAHLLGFQEACLYWDSHPTATPDDARRYAGLLPPDEHHEPPVQEPPIESPPAPEGPGGSDDPGTPEIPTTPPVVVPEPPVVIPPVVIPPVVPVVTGIARDVSLNTLLDVASTGEGVRAWLRAWSGVALLRLQDRVLVFFQGGGHADSAHNGRKVYDSRTGLFSTVKNSAKVFFKDGYCGDTVSGWLWANAEATAVQEGEDWAAHWNASALAIPPDIIPGTPKGCLLYLSTGSMPNHGQKGTNQPHIFRLDQGVDGKLENFGAKLPKGTGHGPAIFDSKRNRAYVFAGSDPTEMMFLDLKTGAVGTISLSARMHVYYATGFYDPKADRIIVVLNEVRQTKSIRLYTINPETGRVDAPPITGGLIALGARTGGWAFDESKTKLVFYSGFGETVHTLSDMNGVWLLESQTVTGLARLNTENPHFNRVVHKAGDTYLWFANHDSGAQEFTLA